jgi:RNA polymerase sigma-70 factor (ECF subfamily)
MPEIDDAVQEVFVECFRPGGVLAKADPGRPGGFRAFFYGALRNVAARHEQQAGRKSAAMAVTPSELDRGAGAGESASVVFDRAWARAVMREAAARHTERARTAGPAALRRHEILRLRFQEGMPIRDIARLWQQEATFVHHEYATARKEFEAALREVVAERQPGSTVEQERILREMIDALR